MNPGPLLLSMAMLAVVGLPVSSRAGGNSGGGGQGRAGAGEEDTGAAGPDGRGGTSERSGDEPVELPPVDVVGYRPLPKARLDSAAASWVVPVQRLREGGTDLARVLDTVPGARVVRLGGLDDFARVSLRGSTPEQVRVYLDGVLLNGLDGGGVDLSTIPVGHLGRVEVYRSAAPAMFGGSAIGGVVHLWSRSSRGLRVGLEGGSFGTRGLVASTGWGSGSVGLTYRGTEGDFTYLDDNGTRYDPSDDRRVVRENDRSDTLGLLARGSSMGGRVRLVQSLLWRRRGLPGPALYQTRESRLTQARSVTGLTFATSRGRDLDLELRASVALGLTMLHDPVPEIGLSPRETRDLTVVPGLGGSLSVGSDAGWLRVTADYRHDGLWAHDELSEPGENIGYGRHVLEGLAQVGAEVAGSARVSVAGGVELAAAQRGVGGGDGRQVDGSLRLSIEVPAGALVSFKSNLGRSVRLPTLFELFGRTGYSKGNPGLAPETSWYGDLTMEIGSGTGADRFRVQVGPFVRRVTDLIQFVQTAQHLSVAMNVDSALVAGIEVGAMAKLLGHLDLTGAYTYMLTRDTSDISARRGRELPRRPRHSLHLSGELYTRSLLGARRVSTFVEWDEMSANALDPANLVWTEPRHLLSAGFRVELPWWGTRLELVGRNLLDDPTSDLTGFPLPGRSLFLSVSARPL